MYLYNSFNLIILTKVTYFNYFCTMENHKLYMERCIELASMGLGSTYPNPLVGCVIVNNNKIIGEGWHQKSGNNHAEVAAINQVKDKILLQKSTLYVNLEPCSFHGKTPPCSNLILNSGIKRVVIGSIDFNPDVNGNGVKFLKKNGIEVITNILSKKSFKSFCTVESAFSCTNIEALVCKIEIFIIPSQILLLFKINFNSEVISVNPLPVVLISKISLSCIK